MKNVDPELTLYRFFDGSGRLLYIGQTISAWDRMRGHRADSPFWPMVKRVDFENGRFANPAELAAAEVAAIKAERPVYNKMHADPAVRLEMLAETVGSDPISGLGEDPTVDEVKIALFRGEVSLSEIGQRYPLLYIDHLKGLRAAVIAGQELVQHPRSPSTDAGGSSGVDAFWSEMEPVFVWDLLPWSFLYQLYLKWIKARSRGVAPLGRNKFIQELRELVAEGFGDSWRETQRTRWVGQAMDQPEPLIAQYGLRQWADCRYDRHLDPIGYSSPVVSERAEAYRGLLRIDGAAVP